MPTAPPDLPGLAWVLAQETVTEMAVDMQKQRTGETATSAAELYRFMQVGPLPPCLAECSGRTLAGRRGSWLQGHACLLNLLTETGGFCPARVLSWP